MECRVKVPDRVSVRRNRNQQRHLLIIISRNNWALLAFIFALRGWTVRYLASALALNVEKSCACARKLKKSHMCATVGLWCRVNRMHMTFADKRELSEDAQAHIHNERCRAHAVRRACNAPFGTNGSSDVCHHISNASKRSGASACDIYFAYFVHTIASTLFLRDTLLLLPVIGVIVAVADVVVVVVVEVIAVVVARRRFQRYTHCLSFGVRVCVLHI